MEKRTSTGPAWALAMYRPITVMYLILKMVPGTKAALLQTLLLRSTSVRESFSMHRPYLRE